MQDTDFYGRNTEVYTQDHPVYMIKFGIVWNVFFNYLQYNSFGAAT